MQLSCTHAAIAKGYTLNFSPHCCHSCPCKQSTQGVWEPLVYGLYTLNNKVITHPQVCSVWRTNPCPPWKPIPTAWLFCWKYVQWKHGFYIANSFLWLQGFWKRSFNAGKGSGWIQLEWRSLGHIAHWTVEYNKAIQWTTQKIIQCVHIVSELEPKRLTRSSGISIFLSLSHILILHTMGTEQEHKHARFRRLK